MNNSSKFLFCVTVSAILVYGCLAVGVINGENVSIEEASNTLGRMNEFRKIITWSDIFANNFLIVLSSLAPFVSLDYMTMIMYRTGTVIGEQAKACGVGGLSYLANVCLSVSGLLENTAYILALAVSMMWFFNVYSLLKKKTTLNQFAKQTLKITFKVMVFVVILLFVSSIIEVYNISGVIR